MGSHEDHDIEAGKKFVQEPHALHGEGMGQSPTELENMLGCQRDCPLIPRIYFRQ